MERHSSDKFDMESTIEYNPGQRDASDPEIDCVCMRDKQMQVNFWRETRIQRLRDSRLTRTRIRLLTQM